MEPNPPAMNSSFLSTVKEFILKSLLSTLLFLFAPVFLFLSIPIFLWRIVVKHAALLLRKDLSKMLTTRGQMFAVDKINEAPKCNIVITMAGEGVLKAEDINSFLYQRLIKTPPKDPSGNDRYPELRQYLVEWGGYYFWKDAEDFSPENHCTILDEDKNYTEEDLKSLAQKYLGMKWPKGKPLWDVVLIKNYVPSVHKHLGLHSAVIFRTHHSLGDGYSFLYFMMETIAGRQVMMSVVPNYFSRSLPQLFLYGITFPFRAAWESADLLVRCFRPFALRAYNVPDKTLLKGPDGSNLKLESSVAIPISLVKDVKSHFNTSFAAVQFAAIAGALRDFHLTNGLDVPRVFPLLTVLPYPGHKLYKFRNHMGGAVINLPTYEPDPLKRLQLCQKDYKRVKNSTFPVLSFYALSVMGCYVSPITRLILKIHPIPAGLTSFPGGDEYISFLGIKWKDCVGYVGTFEGNGGFCLVSASYGDVFRMSAVGHPCVFSDQDMQSLTKLLEHHFDVLHKEVKSINQIKEGKSETVV